MTTPGPAALPQFLRPLAARAARGSDVLVDRLVRAPVPRAASPRSSAVLLLVTGTELAEARIALQERGHALRSQPGQFGLPGGGREPQDADDVATALREAREEIGLRAEEVSVLGPFAPVDLPHRAQRVVPVLAWSPREPDVGVVDPVEVERLAWARLAGSDSLADPRRRFRGRVGERDVGIAYDLPEDVFVWGFTAALLEATLRGVGAGAPAPDREREIPPHRRR